MPETTTRYTRADCRTFGTGDRVNISDAIFAEAEKAGWSEDGESGETGALEYLNNCCEPGICFDYERRIETYGERRVERFCFLLREVK